MSSNGLSEIADLTGGGLYTTASGIALAPIHGLFSNIISPTLRWSGYDGNMATPNVIPPLEIIIKDFVREYPHEAALHEKLLSAHGVPINASTVPNFPEWQFPMVKEAASIWNRYIDSTKMRPLAPVLIDLEARGFFGDTQNDKASLERFRKLVKWSNIDPDSWKEVRASLLYRLDLTVLTELYRRKFLTKDDFLSYCQAIGICQQSDRLGVEYMTKIIPPATELAVMARRFAFADQSVIDALGLDAEYPADFAYWAERSGLGKVKGMSEGGFDGKETDFAKNTWRIHWNTIAPSLAYVFAQRFRKDRDNFGIPPELQDLVFPISDPNPGKLSLYLALRDAGYTEPFRPFLAGISYRTFGFRQIGQIQYYGLAPQKNNDKGLDFISNRLQDSGYQKDSADLFAQTIIKQNDQRKAAQQLGVTRALIEDSWRIGTINTTSAVTLLKQIGYSDSEANAAVTAWELGREHELGKRLIAAIRKNFLLGDYSPVNAIAALVNSGINAERAKQHVLLWEQEQRQYKLERSPSILSKWLWMGLIDEAEFRRRLINIGWASEDADRILQAAIFEAARKAQPKEQKPSGKGGRGGMAKPSELTKAEIKEMLSKHILTLDEAIAELKGLRLDAIDIDRLLRLWGYQIA